MAWSLRKGDFQYCDCGKSYVDRSVGLFRKGGLAIDAQVIIKEFKPQLIMKDGKVTCEGCGKVATAKNNFNHKCK